MTSAALLTELRTRGVVLFVEGGGMLRYRAPRGALTPELRAALAAHKSELLALLQEPARPLDVDAGDVAAVLLRGTVVGDVWLVTDLDVLADHPDIAGAGLPVFTFAELPHLRRLDADALRAAAAVKRMFPTSRVVQ